MRFGDDYYSQLAEHYRHRRDLLLPYLSAAGFEFHVPDGSYYVVCNFSDLSDLDDTAFVKRMIETVGVAGVPGGSFYRPKDLGRSKVRFMFSKRDETLIDAGKRLAGLRDRLAG